MNCHARDLGQLSADRAIKLLGGGMVRAMLDRVKDGPPLCRDRQAVFAVSGEKPVDSLLFFCRTHHLGDEYMHQMIRICK